MRKIENFIKKILGKRINGINLMVIFLAIIFLRVFIEKFLATSSSLSAGEMLIEYLHNFFFFSIAYLLVWIFLSLVLKINPQKLAYILIWAALLIIFPPLLDMLKTHGQVFWSFYLLSSPKDLLSQFITFFGHLPSGIVYFGTKIIFLLAIILCFGLILTKTKDFLKALIGAIGIYAILFFMGSFPTFFVIVYDFFSKTQKIASIQGYNIAQFFSAHVGILGLGYQGVGYSFAASLNLIYFLFLILLLSSLFLAINKKKFWALIKNYRYAQIIYHSGLFLIGLGLGFLAYPQNFNLNIFSILALVVSLVSIWLVWGASVIFNDIYDFPIDQISNPQRPLPQNIFELRGYASLGIILFILSIIGALTLGWPFAFLLIAFQILAWFYSAPPFRLKKFPLVATLVSSSASIMILFFGFILVSSNQTIHYLSWIIPILLVITYTLSLPIKDLKDIAGDKKYSIWTIPVIFGEKKSRLIIASSLFVSFMLSVFFLNEKRLFPWALLFGIITFFLVINEKIKPQRLPYWVLSAVFVYGLFLVKIIFL